MKKYKPAVLAIIDGFGISPDKIGSPWEAAKHPAFEEIEKNFPFTALQASGIAVGLPWGKEGNSEVGHLTIGAGKIIYNHLPRISTAIEDGTFFSNEAFLKAVKRAQNNNSALHILGLFSSGTVHAYEEHLYALLELAKRNDLQKVFLHLFSDGKDASPREGAAYFGNLEKLLREKYPNVKIASVIGRKYAMDRDANWDRTEKAFNLFVKGEGEAFETASSYIKENYQKEIFDEMIGPGFLKNSESRIKESDAVIFYNFREDSERQLSSFFLQGKIKNLLVATMTEYDKKLPVLVAFESLKIEAPLAKIISDAGLSQLHLAESEKYAHITYFLNGGKEEPFKGEERILVPSPRVSSYSQTPEMSADKITEAVVSNLEKYDFIAVNFANADMVGHTGDFQATVKALEKIDSCIGKIIEKIFKIDGVLVITADHGNAEEKIYKMTGEKKTKHSANPVPFYFVANDFERKTPATNEEIKQNYRDVKGTLSDVAPTVLSLLGLEKPPEMTGKNLMEII
jgi:2,3-bisphosphoglycerate-independent phosphoglycerate mutase